MKLQFQLKFILLILFGSLQNCQSEVETLAVSLVQRIIKVEHCTCVHVLNFNDTEFNVAIFIKALAKLKFSSGLCLIKNIDIIKMESCVNPLIVIPFTRAISLIPMHENMGRSTWVVLISTLGNVNAIFDKIDIAFDANLIIANLKNNNMMSLYRAQKNFPLILNQYSPIKESLQSERCRRNNFQGKKFIAAHENSYPNSYINDCNNLDGYFPSMWSLLEPVFNFTTRSQIYNLPVGSFKEEKWNGLIEKLLNNEIDVISTDVNMESCRVRFLEFPLTLLTSRFHIYYKRTGLHFGYSSYLKPLDKYVWMTIILWIAISGIVLLLKKHIAIHFNFDADEQWNKQGFIFFVLFTLQTLSQQGSVDVPKSASLRILFLMSYMLAAILLPAYSASLISSLAQRAPATLSLEDFVNRGSSLLILKGSASVNYFETATDPVHQQLQKQIIQFEDNSGSNELYLQNYRVKMYTQLCKNPNMGGLFGELNIRYAKIEEAGKCTMDKIEGWKSKVHQSIVLKKYSPFTAAFKTGFLLLKERGMLKREEAKFFRKPETEGGSFHWITFSNITPILIAYAIGIIFSIFILLYEIYEFRSP